MTIAALDLSGDSWTRPQPSGSLNKAALVERSPGPSDGKRGIRQLCISVTPGREVSASDRFRDGSCAPATPCRGGVEGNNDRWVGGCFVPSSVGLTLLGGCGDWLADWSGTLSFA